MGEKGSGRPAWLVASLAGSVVVAVAATVGSLAAGRNPLQTAVLVVLGSSFGWLVRKQRLSHALIGLVGVAAVAVGFAVQTDLATGLIFACVVPLGWFLREEQAWRLRGTSPSRETWTGGKARAGQVLLVVVLAVLVGSVVWAVVTVDSSDGLLDSLGPASAVAVAAVLGSLVVLLRQLWVRRGTRRWSRDAGRDVPAVVVAVAAERDVAPSARATRADDASLGRASDHAEMAVLFLESGPRLEAVQELERLLQEAQGWEPSAPLTRQVADLDGLVRRGRRTRGQVDTELRRGPVRG